MISYTKVSKAFRFVKNKLLIAFKERRLGHLRYIYEQNGSDELMIVFSGFGSNVRKYNYMKTLKDSSIDKLFILDVWGYKGSYYWFEKGNDEPKQLVSRLIESIGGINISILPEVLREELVPYIMVLSMM